ncbi:hypothetical protein [Actinomadura sp. 21ATH]|uniref:hypothetical protein n=1 Tax=Actinomadura sp. 21ATH TaxID=1735444 RepID=UPI0035BF8368
MVAIDWRWRHGPVSGPLHGATALTAAAAVGALPVVDLPPGWVLAGGMFATGGAVLRSRYTGLSWPGLGYRVGGLLGGTVWLEHVLAHGWSLGSVAALAGGAVGGGVLWPAVRRRDRVVMARREGERQRVEAAAADAAEQEMLHGLAEQWTHLIERAANIRVRITGIEHWRFPGPDGALRETGYTLQAVLPRSGVTVEQLRGHMDGLASAARLPLGCGVEVLPGSDRGTALIDVSTHDALQDEIPLPVATSPRAIRDGLDIGVRRNGAPAPAQLLWESGALVGETGSGKSNQLLAILARYLECHDTLALVIDHNGGAIALPWLRPWVQGEIDKPPILWVADKPAESELVCDWLIAVIEHRKRAYFEVQQAGDTDKLDPSPKVPHLLLVIDEFASLPHRIQDKVIDINNRGRGAAVRVQACGLRGTHDGLPTVLTKQTRTKIAMQTADDDELRYFFAQSAGRLKAADAPLPGYGFIAVDKQPATVFKGYRMLPSTIREVARRSDAWRPDLDEVTLGMTPEWRRVFEERWTRSRHLVAAMRGHGTGGGGDELEGPEEPLPSEGAGGRDEPPPPPGGTAGILDALGEAVEKLRDSTNQAPGPGRSLPEPGAPDEAFEAIVAGQTVVPELVALILAVMGDQPRMHTADIARRIGARQETLGSLLSTMDIRPLPNAFAIGGSERARGYRRVDVEAAAARIRAGELEPPAEVVAWRPDAPPEPE